MKVGQAVYISDPYCFEDDIQEAIVLYIGKKYFKTDYNPKHRISLETMWSDKPYGYEYKVFLTREEIPDAKLYNELRTKLQSMDGFLTLNQLKRINEILEESK